MTTKFKLALMSAAFVYGAAMTSCSNEVSNDPTLPSDNVSNLLIKSPEILAYTSGQSFGAYGTKAEGDVQDEETETAQAYVSHNDIEINLALNEEFTEPGETEEGETYEKDYISSHFSLHVRTPRDVKVRIPVPVDYYCEADDMAIVKKHLEDHYVYGDQEHTLSMEIGENTVTVTVAYDEEGFTITTSGINQSVIDYLAEEYKDGITFEIWNYYNTETTRADLQTILNGSTVEFIGGDDNVDYYVNAFNELRETDEDGEEIGRTPNEWDCTVSIVEAQAANFTAITPGSEEYLDGFHGYNGSNLNKVFRHNRE